MKFLKSYILVLILASGVPAVTTAEPGAENSAKAGTVVETMISGGYLYMKLEEQGTWIATSPLPQPVAVGDRVEYTGGMEMRDFYSKTLDRTFGTIFFVQNAKLAGQSADAMHAAAMKAQGDSGMTIPKPVTVNAPAAGEISALNEGKTVADILAESAQLNEQTISLNAKVMKVSKKIMGKNWVTLQDGTGTEPQNKLLATSQETVSPGDIVIARGVVRTDVDLGSGYTYNVLLQEVKFSAGIK